MTDETLAPLLTELRHWAYGPQHSEFVYTTEQQPTLIRLLVKELDAQRRLSAEKDAMIQEYMRVGKALAAQIAEKDTKLADCEQRISAFAEEVRHISVRMENSLMTPERLRELLKGGIDID